MTGRYAVNLPLELKKEAEALAKKQGVSLNQFILWSVAEKVSALKAGLDDPNFSGIAYRRGASGIPVPVLRGPGSASKRSWYQTGCGTRRWRKSRLNMTYQKVRSKRL